MTRHDDSPGERGREGERQRGRERVGQGRGGRGGEGGREVGR